MATPLSPNIGSSEIAERIARAAARLFAAEGYDATSVRNIVAAADVTKPTLYYHFESKEALAQTLLTTAIEKLTVGMQEILAGPLPATDKLVAVIGQHFRLCQDDPDLARFAYAMFFGPRSSHLSTVLAELGQVLAGLVAQTVQCLADERIVSRERTDECTAAVRGLITIYTMDYLYRDLSLDSGLSRRLVFDLLDGFTNRATRTLPEPPRN
ncbi:MAG TPA: TetR/AcrR family transcriptional regulator [Pirellulales bacterium]|jgi:AcrR family transcriptional regulator